MAPPGIGGSVEGLHAAAAALESGRVVALTIERGRIESLGDLIASARAAGVPVEVVDDVRPRAETSAPQGVIASCRPLRTVGLDDVIVGEGGDAVVVLDHLEDPRNVGAIARSAAAAGMTGMVVASRRAAPLGATAFKAAAGALERLPVAVVSAIPAALERLRAHGLWVVGLDGSAGRSLFGLDLLTEPVAIVVGAEGTGLARLSAERCDVVARIPMAPGVESLNASVAAALAVFEVARARREA
jgi:23S rRNA (guanosine2251-2'-O)-methyltransferase